MSLLVKLQEKSILQVPLDKYEEKFTFIVNGEKYQTSRIVADLLSPKIAKYHIIDPTIEEINITTETRGEFNKIIELSKFEPANFKEDEIPFFIEIIEKLDNRKEFLHIIKDEIDNIEIKSIEEAVQFLIEHQKHQEFYSEEIEREIEYISTNFSSLMKEDEGEKEKEGTKIRPEIKSKIQNIKYDILLRILRSGQIQIDKEDDLIDFINELYLEDHEYVNLYSEVYFNNVTTNKIKEFLYIFSYNEMTNEIWRNLSTRLSQEIIKPKPNSNSNSNSNEQEHRYKNHSRSNETSQTISTSKPNKVILYSNQNFDGIINYLRKQSNIKNEIDISYSSKASSDDPFLIFEYDNKEHNFYTNSSDYDPWLCIEFKNHKIKPTNYTIRSGTDSDNPRNFIIECSNDKKEWIKIDEQNDIAFLKELYSIHTFSVNNSFQQTFKYFRIRHTGSNWSGISRLQFSEIEIYGEIF